MTQTNRWVLFGCLAALVLPAIYPIWHVHFSEQVIAQSESNGRVAKAVVYYPPWSPFSYLGAYIRELRTCGLKLKVNDKNGKTLKSKLLSASSSYDLPSDIEVDKLEWNSDGTHLVIEWNGTKDNRRTFDFPH